MPRVLQSGSSATMNGVAISAEGTLTRLIHVGCISRSQFDVTHLLLAAVTNIGPTLSLITITQPRTSPQHLTNEYHQCRLPAKQLPISVSHNNSS